MEIKPPVRHRHLDLINQWANDMTGTAVLYKPSPRSDWFRSHSPVWDQGTEYKVVPVQHLDIAVKYLNDPSILIQYKHIDDNIWVSDEWDDAIPPVWSSTCEYRIKPKPVTYYFAARKASLGGYHTTSMHPTREEIESYIDNTWTIHSIEMEEE